MDIEYRGNDYNDDEYILSRVINVLSEDDIILEFDISENDDVSIFSKSVSLRQIVLLYSNFNCIIDMDLSWLGLFIFRRKVSNYAK